MAPPSISRTERAYLHVRDGILGGRWPAGATLSTYGIAGELGISRTPVGIALKRLESEGLVEIIPQVGCRVAGASADALADLFPVRATIEGLAAETAARRIAPTELAELEELQRRMDAAPDRRAHDALDTALHLRIVETSGMPQLVHAARSVWTSLGQQLPRLAGDAPPDEATAYEHREILDALRRRSPRRARMAAERHALSCGARLASHLPGGRTRGLAHAALVYGTDEDFVAGASAFVGEGLDRGERVLAVTTPRNIELLRGGLGERGGEVEYRESAEWYHAPAHTMLAYERYLEHADAERVRVVGEPVWDRGWAGAITEWTRYESIINVEFALSPISILCPYDARELPEAVLGRVGQTHPEVVAGREAVPSPDFADPRLLSRELDQDPLDEPRGPVAEHPVTGDLASVRAFALEQARGAGVHGKRLVDALLAVQEVADNVVAHGSGRGRLRAWATADELVYEVTDDGGGLTDPLAGHLVLGSGLRAEPGGLWIARLLCDLVEVRSREGGLLVRLHVALA